MTSTSSTPNAHDVAIVRALEAMLEDAVERSDFVVARDLAAQIADELRRSGVHGSRR